METQPYFLTWLFELSTTQNMSGEEKKYKFVIKKKRSLWLFLASGSFLLIVVFCMHEYMDFRPSLKRFLSIGRSKIAYYFSWVKFWTPKFSWVKIETVYSCWVKNRHFTCPVFLVELKPKPFINFFRSWVTFLV